MAKAQAVFGGLLSGVGQGMVMQHEQRREEALERARQIREDKRLRKDREFTRERDQADREHRSGLLSQVDTDREGNRIGITASGETRELGYQAPLDSESQPGSMSSEDQRLWDAAIQRHTSTEDGFDDRETTDWEAVSASLREQGREDLAQLAGPAAGLSDRIDVNSSEYIEAARRADEWVSSQAGWLSTDSSDFDEFGGNREQARQQKTLEFYDQLTGRSESSTGSQRSGLGAGGSAGQGEGGQAQRGQSASQTPPGSGSRQDPYKATSQDHIDWFIENAPAGAVIEADGQLYTK